MEIIIPAYKEKNEFQSQVFDETPKHGITRQEILEKHYKVYGRMLDAQQLRQQIIPVLETSGLIYQEQDPNDKRKILISPSTFFGAQQQNNSDDECGVDTLSDNQGSGLDDF